MKTNKRESTNTIIERFNENQRVLNKRVSKKNHKSIFIDFYFKNFYKNNQQP
ncbi:hypothetical protein THERMOS_959 [Bathymodiolus thermophilus thioautotrophic gill symbiont]|uniref:Transposase n=1 Tax=Bathymodiolus thermophilus thioautotrophic gill symbiont TaxID=2360 RepID=A0A8H9CHB1_9GAMM|nr:hypothetical protein THERMOS_959 [Bathymodiolus thermophilus thioautotrophic gill symbiont]